MKSTRGTGWWVFGFILTAFVGACTDETVIFREVERELFEDPPPEALNFLGYTDQDDKLTVCGNCHVGMQSGWEETGHADAWAGLQDSGHAQQFCESCHTTNDFGNLGTVAAGFNASPDPRYHDVQCESCHNAGLDHVQNPDSDANKPLASALASLDAEGGCGECHAGSHHPFTEQWEDSGHASVIGFAADRPGCTNCHSGDGALTAWGEHADYIEKDSFGVGTGNHMPVNCVVCHDPHGSPNPANLRFPLDTPDATENLCGRCHNRRTVPDPGSSHGLHPHSPEAALLDGDVGWIPPGAPIDAGQIVATHGSEANPSLCATCHVNTFTITDAATGEFVLNNVGHTFAAMPCVDEQGIPTTEDCGLTIEERSYEGCTGAGCHGSVDGVVAAMSTATLRIMTLAEELHDLLLIVDPNGEDQGGEIDARNPTFTVAEGAYFNWALAEHPGRERVEDRLVYAGTTAHNPFLIEQLLIFSIQAVEEEYQVQASASLVLEPLLPGND